MASVKNLKKQINHTLGDIITDCFEWKAFNADKDAAPSEAIVDEAITTFDTLIAKLNAKDVENKKAHFKALKTEFKESVNSLNDKIKSL